MNRRIIGLLATVCLASACSDKPVGQMEPIPRPPGMDSAPAKAEAPAAKPAPAPAPPSDPSKVVMRWKLDAPTAFRLTTTSSASAPASKDKKDKQPESAASERETSSIFVLRKTGSGEYAVTLHPQEPGGEADQGTMSERGFVVDGLSGPLRTAAALVLELPLEAVGKGATWALGMDLVNLSTVSNYVEQKAERHNQVKLVELTPAENGEQVATLEYDLSENVSGTLRAFRLLQKPEKKDADGKKDAARKKGASADTEDEEQKPLPVQNVSAELRVKGRGEFLVKAGRWRSWEGTLTTSTEGALPGLSSGELKLRLTPLDAVPPELLPQQAKK